MKQSQPNAFISLDFVLAILPVLLILFYGLSLSNLLVENSTQNMESQILFDKLLSASDYVVRYAAVEKTISPNPKESKSVPNKISEEEFSKLDVNSLKEKLGLSSLEISFEKSASSGACIYRLVLYNNEIKKLYFCGNNEYN